MFAAMRPLPLVDLLPVGLVLSSVALIFRTCGLEQTPTIVYVSLYALPRFHLIRVLKVRCVGISQLATTTRVVAVEKGSISPPIAQLVASLYIPILECLNLSMADVLSKSLISSQPFWARPVPTVSQLIVHRRNRCPHRPLSAASLYVISI